MQPASDVAENLGRFLVRSVEAMGMTSSREVFASDTLPGNDFESRSVRLRHLTAENLCPFATVVRVHDGVLVE